MPETDTTKEAPADKDKTDTRGTGTVPLVTPPPAPPAGQLDKGQREALRRRLRERFH